MTRSSISVCMLVIPIAAFGLGCGPTMDEAVRRDRVLTRARFDLNCQEQIEVVQINENAYGAIGCRRRASYVMHNCSNTYYTRACTVTLDGLAEEVDAPVVPVHEE